MDTEFEHTIVDVAGKLVVSPVVRTWCQLPYPDHPHGCPNFGKHDECPPRVCLITEFIDLKKWPLRFLVTRFNLATHAAKMKAKHPGISDRMARNLLYWQPRVRKEQRRRIDEFFVARNRDEFNITLIPEAMGVQVFATLDACGIEYEMNPVSIVTKVALIGVKK